MSTPLTNTTKRLVHGDKAPPCNLVIMGAGGDLTRRLLMPALYNLVRTGLLPDQFSLIGVDRQDLTDEGFRDRLDQAVRSFASEKSYSAEFDETHWKHLLAQVSYVRGDFNDPELYRTLKQRLDGENRDHATSENAIFYLAVASRFFGLVVNHLGQSGLVEEGPERYRRVIIEKPFGNDYESARALNQQILRTLHEDQIYRMDHFLGKETVQNIMVKRFANGIFEPLWNRNHIDHVQITVAETVGVESRAGFYETTGAMRDMVPNHVFQLLALICMEPPNSFCADAIRTEKTKALDAVHVINPQTDIVRGQYRAGSRDGKALKGYREEDGIQPESLTETYVAMKLGVDSWRWSGVPFYLRTGKRMAQRSTEISIEFKRPPFSLFRDTQTEELEPNTLILKLQPDEGASLAFGAKIPGPAIQLGQVHMDFHYKDYFQNAPSTGYETLIYDCMIGDATLFQRADSVEAGWRIVQPYLDLCKEQPDALLEFYPAGGQGPTKADALLETSGRKWRKLS